MNPKAILGYFVAVIALLGIIVWAGSRNSTVSTAQKDDPSRPIATIVGAKSFDFGKITNQDIKRKVFTVKNNGQSDLQLTNVSTSCDCTYVFITAGGQKSPKFTMHGQTSWVGVVKPGETGKIEVIYEPAIMPVHGVVERMVMVTTNDPNLAQLEFKINAEVN